jgi:REP element-mobilizing transposase RayT
MGQSLSQIYLHLVFSTKNRAPFLKDKSLRGRVHAYLAGTCGQLHSPSLIVGGVEDHVHVLCRFSKELTVSQLLQELKRESSKWIKSLDAGLRGFYWQQGYGAFSISPAYVGPLKQYIARQEEHHRQETFQDELRRFLKKHSIAYDERYVWN